MTLPSARWGMVRSRMRFLVAGLICLALGIGLTEYQRRHPDGASTDTTTPTSTAKPKYPPEVAELLELEAAHDEPMAKDPAVSALLVAPTGTPVAGFAPVAEGAWSGRLLSGGFGAAIFVVDAAGKSAVVRAEAGETAKVIFTRSKLLTGLAVDGSTVFIAEDGLVASTHARGGEGFQVRARFKNARVTSLAASGDALVVTLMPSSADASSTARIGAVVAIDASGELTLIASEQVQPHGVQTDGKDAWWLGGDPSSLWRGGLDGSYSSKISDEAEAPLVFDRDVLYFRSPAGTGPELKRIGRAGGKLQSVITADVSFVTASTGLVRLATRGAAPALLEVVSGGEATKLLDLPGSARGLAQGGTNVFLLTQGEDGRSVLWAK